MAWQDVLKPKSKYEVVNFIFMKKIWPLIKTFIIGCVGITIILLVLFSIGNIFPDDDYYSNEISLFFFFERIIWGIALIFILMIVFTIIYGIGHVIIRIGHKYLQ